MTLRRSFSTVSCARSRSTPALAFPPADAPAQADQDPEDQFAVTIWDAQGRLVHASLPSVHIPPQIRPGYANAEAAGEDWRVYTAGDSARMMQVAQHEVVRQEIAQTAALGAAAPVLIAIPLAWLVVGWAMNRVLARLNTLSIELAERSVGATASIALDGIPAEVAPLARSMNSLIVRLHDAVEAQRRFVSDAAHELRTPLAGMQIQVENLSPARREAPIDGATAALARGVRRASALVNQLLDLARLERAAPSRTRPSTSMRSSSSPSRITRRSPTTSRFDLEVNFACQAVCRGAPDEVRALLSSLIDNAVRYTPSCGRIDVSIGRARRPLRRRSLEHGSAPSEGRRGATSSIGFFAPLRRRRKGRVGIVDRPPGRRTAWFRPHGGKSRGRRKRASSPAYPSRPQARLARGAGGRRANSQLILIVA